MTISVNYQKRRNIPLFNKFQTNKYTNLTNIIYLYTTDFLPLTVQIGTPLI